MSRQPDPSNAVSHSPPSALSPAVGYARVSSREQEHGGFSIPAQLKLIHGYAQEHQLEMVQEFVDVETAKHTGRTNFQAMIHYLSAHPTIKTLLVEKTDRLYRNFRDFVQLEDLGVHIHLIKEGDVLSPDSRSHAKFIHGIKVLMAKNYIDNLSEEVKKGMREKCEQGGYPGKAPVGYRHNVEHHTIELDPEKAPVIHTLYERYATGQYTLKDLRQYCLSLNFTTRRSERRISLSHIERILKNQFYTGEFEWNGHRYQGSYPPLISRELYDRVQVAFARHAHSKGRPGHQFAFRGLLTCGRCGCAITAEIKKRRYVYYRCTGFKGKCGEKALREETLQELLAESVKAIHIPREIIQDIQQTLQHQRTTNRQHQEHMLKHLHSQYNKLQTYIDQAYVDKLEGKISEAFWSTKTQEWENQQVTLQQEIATYEKGTGQKVKEAESILELANRAYVLYQTQSPHEQRRLLNVILSNSTLKDGTLQFSYKKPFDVLAERVKNEEWLGEKDSNPHNQNQNLTSYP